MMIINLCAGQTLYQLRAESVPYNSEMIYENLGMMLAKIHSIEVGSLYGPIENYQERFEFNFEI